MTSLILVCAAAVALTQSPARAATPTDTYRLDTTIPSPSGFFTSVFTTSGSYLGINSSNVGIGTLAPQAKLDVNGVIRLRSYTALEETTSPDLLRAGDGSLRYDATAGQLRVKTSGAWQTIGGGIGNLQYTDCLWIDGVNGAFPNWSVVISIPTLPVMPLGAGAAPRTPPTAGAPSCPGTRMITGFHIYRSQNTEENAEYIFTPTMIAARRPNAGSSARVSALCCNLRVSMP